MANTMTTTTLETKILEVLESLSDWELISVNNEYEGNVNGENYINSMDEFDDLHCGMTPWEIARAVTYGDFCAAHDYFRYNAYGNLESTDYVADWIDLEEIAEYCARNEDALYCDEIQEAIDEYNDGLEESEDDDYESEDEDFESEETA